MKPTLLRSLLAQVAIVATFAVLALPLTASAAEASPPAAGGGLIELLTPVIALVVTFAVKQLTRLPGWVLPIVASLAGAGYEAVSQLSLGGSPNLIQGLIYGGAAVALHQLKAQLTKPKPIAD